MQPVFIGTPVHGSEAAVHRAAVRLDSVSFRYGSVPALDRVSLEVPRGSITGLLGRNGAGKSTSIRMLAGLIRPAEGRVEALGLALPGDATEVRRRTGYLLSEPALFAYLTPRETLRFIGESYELSPEESERRTEDLLAFFELDEVGDRFTEGFSTGMRKRLGLAAALIHSPDLLVLDEPFESLDPLIIRKLKRLLLTYRAGGGTVLLSSHLIDAVDEVCDRIAILENGRLLLSGSTEETKMQLAGRMERGALEELLASVVVGPGDASLEWLRPGDRRS